jgi:hypothetical protein
VCQRECGSLERLRQHTIACFLEAARRHDGSVHPPSVRAPRVNGSAGRGERNSEGARR